MNRRDEMLQMRLEEKRTLQEIADEFKISRERVRQIIGNTGNVRSPIIAQREEQRQKEIWSKRYWKFWLRVNVLSDDECWNWLGPLGPGVKTHRYGSYPQVSYLDRVTGSHRAAWILTNGQIPGGKHVLHTCDNVLCCNPDHLYIGTHQDNMR